MKALAFAHAVWGAALLTLAAWWTAATLRILPHMATGTVRENLPIAATVALAHSGPLVALGVWLIALGRATWRGDPGLRRRLLRTHALLLVPALASVFLGVSLLQAAQRSAARGGGLLGGLGLIPLALGAFVGLLNVCAIAAGVQLGPYEDRRAPRGRRHGRGLPRPRPEAGP